LKGGCFFTVVEEGAGWQ